MLQDAQNQYYYATSKNRSHARDKPTISPIFTRAFSPLPESCCVKRRSLLGYGDRDASSSINSSNVVLSEAEVYEVFRSSRTRTSLHTTALA
ncbi:uncharacterized protein K452DRAFT_302304 [Aplosporella prunicola CBS 121167]|uniref:Uncharacterized protein n=1 Tax=Aplosporella prunicola CBS 121167 TaxID=1176127 RepID=A0A6A6AYL2_9PEZI|nr:uncharacterized protein K452DRAFT_302304 [Aplosporella prunicola CBS 121167]KAF2137022.1 hypothetical protein K452DRAFT_302304 [Aplosporella prunicola CBS 121167]